jgi:prepilin-type N-terminal cleavage/methylation domain-containing protein
MKNLHTCQKTDKNGGFTIIELMVAIVVFGILTAAATVSWSSFMRYQELRDEASAFHKKLLAAKAQALESGDSVTIKYTTGYDKYIVTRNKEDNSDPPLTITVSDTVSLSKNVKIRATGDMTANGDLPHLSPSQGGGILNNWKDSIVIASDNLNTFKSGRVIIETTDAKKIFCIQKDDSNIKPLMYYKNGANGTWKKI